MDSRFANEDNNHLLYVFDETNNLYGVVPPSYKWNHSWILAGCPVKAAGFINTDEEDDIIAISNESGHYIPTILQMLPAFHNFSNTSNNFYLI